MDNTLTTEEKIDFIYNDIIERKKAEKRKKIISWGIKIAILGYVYFLIMVVLPNMIGGMIPDIPSASSVKIDSDALQDIMGRYLGQ